MSLPSNPPSGDLDTWPSIPFQRVVVKFGTNLLTGGTDRLNLETMAALVGQLARLHQEGREVIVVSSGAVAAGRHRLGAVHGLQHTPLRQVCAAVGQSLLMEAYDQLFRWHDITVAQTLVTKTDLADRLSYLNARTTLMSLMDLRVISIVNENDVVAVDELENTTFGDNDALSALIANLVDADVLVLLSDINGLYSSDPAADPSARHIPLVPRVDAAIEQLAGKTVGARSRGGMVTKLQAARTATAGGAGVIIANGREPGVLVKLANGDACGTLFLPSASKVESRKRWMLSGLSRRGSLAVDSGAANALTHQNRSLLPAGVVEVKGAFSRGDIVVVEAEEGREIAYGIVNYGAEELGKLAGLRSSEIEPVLGHHYGDEVIHRNNLVVL
ncbi:MAG: glutamate 5-kinase [Chloroflexota bacterium]